MCFGFEDGVSEVRIEGFIFDFLPRVEALIRLSSGRCLCFWSSLEEGANRQFLDMVVGDLELSREVWPLL